MAFSDLGTHKVKHIQSLLTNIAFCVINAFLNLAYWIGVKLELHPT